MHLQAHRLAAALNAMVARDVDPGRAEALVTGSCQVHHVIDRTGTLGGGEHEAVPLRLVLGRIAATAAPEMVWQVFTVQPGRLGGLRGPAEVTRLALDHGAITVPSSGGPAWVPVALGTPDHIRAVQWVIASAERPVPPPVPAEAQDSLRLAMSAVEHGWQGAAPREQQPHRGAGMELPGGYPASSAQLWVTATRLAAAAEMARDQGVGSSSFEHTRTEHLLAELYYAAVQTMDSVVSWPQRALRE